MRIAFAIYGMHFLVLCPLLLLLGHVVGLRELLHGQTLDPLVFYGSLAMLVASALLSLGRDFLFMLYPAHGELDRGVTLFNVQLLARTAMLTTLLLAGLGPLWISAGWVLVDVVGGVILLFADLRRRHDWGRLLPGRADWQGFGGGLRRWPAYAVSHAADQVLLHVPVLILGLLALPHLQVVIFNTARTFTNLARQFLTQYGRTFGVETAQLAVTEASLARAHFIKGIRFLGVTAGLLVGGLVGAGALVYELWMPNGDIYRGDVVLAMTLPFLLVGPAQVPLAFLRHSERQGVLACTLAAHAVFSLALGPVGAWLHGALGIAIVLSTLETVCVAGAAARYACSRLGVAGGWIWQGVLAAALSAMPVGLLTWWMSTMFSQLLV